MIDLFRKRKNNIKNIILIGGAGGLGNSLTKELLHDGHIVFIIDKNKEKLDLLKNEVKFNNNLYTFHVDICSYDSFNKCFTEIINLHEQIDVILFLAAIHILNSYKEISFELLTEIFQNNSICHINNLCKMIPYLMPNTKLIYISSLAADVGIPLSSLYCATKAATEKFFESISLELLEQKIHVSILRVGNINTGFNEKGNLLLSDKILNNKLYKNTMNKISSKNGIDPKRVAIKIKKIINSKSTKLYYFIGLNALKAHFAQRLLGKNLSFILLKKYFRIT